MKYNITTLQKEVPENIRLEIYKEALHRIDTRLDYEDRGLCVALPFILFDLKSVFDDYIDTITKTQWHYEDTPKAFPELTRGVLKLLSIIYDDDLINARIKFLGGWIEKLENRLSQTNTD